MSPRKIIFTTYYFSKIHIFKFWRFPENNLIFSIKCQENPGKAHDFAILCEKSDQENLFKKISGFLKVGGVCMYVRARTYIPTYIHTQRWRPPPHRRPHVDPRILLVRLPACLPARLPACLPGQGQRQRQRQGQRQNTKGIQRKSYGFRIFLLKYKGNPKGISWIS